MKPKFLLRDEDLAFIIGSAVCTEMVKNRTTIYIGNEHPRKFVVFNEMMKWVEENATGFYHEKYETDGNGIRFLKLSFENERDLVNFKLMFTKG